MPNWWIRNAKEARRNTLLSSKKWEWKNLRDQCIENGAEEYYQALTRRLRLSYISLFAYAWTIVITIHSTVLICLTNNAIISLKEIGFYIICAFFAIGILYLNRRENLVERFPNLHMITSWLSATMMLLSDFGAPVYWTITHDTNIYPCYESVILTAVYIFLPVSVWQCIWLGLYTSLAYILFYIMAEFQEIIFNLNHIISECVYVLCLNLISFLFLMLRVIFMRASAIEQKKCVYEDLRSLEVKNKERRILLNLIPANIADEIMEDVTYRINTLKRAKGLKSKTYLDPAFLVLSGKWDNITKNCYIKSHDDVTILYADMVRFSQLSSTVVAKTLVEILHELFVIFDMESEKHNVQRIKFLGDCYYCVANVSNPNKNHAQSCVELAFAMLRELQNLNRRLQMELNIRIGVHSGRVQSGVIGARKWQFDIWSEDVEIANALENTGLPGRVHISEATLLKLEPNYIIESGTPAARKSELFLKYNIRTYLITKIMPIDITKVLKPRMGKSARSSLSDYFQDYSSGDIEKQVNAELYTHLEHVPLNGARISFPIKGKDQLTFFCLFLQKWKLEKRYLTGPDVAFKYSFALGILTTVSILFLQFLYKDQSYTIFNSTNAAHMIGCFIVFGGLVLLGLLLWYQRLWMLFQANDDSSRPRNKVSARLYFWSDKLQKSFACRMISYILMTGFQLFMFLHLMVSFKSFHGPTPRNMVNEEYVFSADFMMCCVVLNMSTCFLFTQIPYPLKFCTSTLVVGLYIIVLTTKYAVSFTEGVKINIDFDAENTYLVVILIQFGFFYIINRHTEFVARKNFIWGLKVTARHRQSLRTKETIQILLRNILPTHICDIFLRKQYKAELYWEEYDDVAIMFATFVNLSAETINLSLFNKIICEFDEVLSFYHGMIRIEKIKMSKWTYMAACGLGKSRIRDSSVSHLQRITLDEDDLEDSIFIKRRSMTSRLSFSEVFDKNMDLHVVPVMTRFAIRLINLMSVLNKELLKPEEGQFDGVLRIGIANGPIMAGIVGMDKIHYDIWGNAVNIAARMEQTGVPGQIQVTAEVARILQEDFDISCTFRGKVEAKGYGELETYFVDLDKDIEIITVRPSYRDVSERNSLESFELKI